ncbi:COG4315 family predicted lipoprotein [Hydrogenophaga sp. MI9]|uniref:COG4315 family predicted lipoprotein n=1 Tax=Hydrogenophaga sp. MI9 TaxID=3453719 RepID=UPI003EECEE8F
MGFLHTSPKALLALGLLACVTVASAQPKVTNGILTDEKGMSLYVWDNDLTVPGKSLCTGPCTITWPPMLAKEGAKAFDDHTLLAREDGALQWAHKGRPLYHSANDRQPGDHKGDGFRGIWHLVRP